MTAHTSLRASQQAVALLEKMMLDLYLEKATYHPTQYFAMMAQPLAEDIRKIRREIDALIGLTDFDAGVAAYETARLADAPPPANGIHAPEPVTQPA